MDRRNPPQQPLDAQRRKILKNFEEILGVNPRAPDAGCNTLWMTTSPPNNTSNRNSPSLPKRAVRRLHVTYHTDPSTDHSLHPLCREFHHMYLTILFRKIEKVISGLHAPPKPDWMRHFWTTLFVSRYTARSKTATEF
jgi:hypothetical protein